MCLSTKPAERKNGPWSLVESPCTKKKKNRECLCLTFWWSRISGSTGVAHVQLFWNLRHVPKLQTSANNNINSASSPGIQTELVECPFYSSAYKMIRRMWLACDTFSCSSCNNFIVAALQFIMRQQLQSHLQQRRATCCRWMQAHPFVATLEPHSHCSCT